MDDYERRHFAYDKGAFAVSEATLDLMASFYSRPVPRGDAHGVPVPDGPPLRAAFGYQDPPGAVQERSAAGYGCAAGSSGCCRPPHAAPRPREPQRAGLSERLLRWPTSARSRTARAARAETRRTSQAGQ